MTIGLKRYLPELSPSLGLSADALYERQRALVRLGVLLEIGGRGPGSGVRATPETVSWLLLSILATDSLSEVDERVRVLGEARIRKRKVCRLTGARTFGKALGAILDRPDISKLVQYVGVQRQTGTAALDWEISGRGYDGENFISQGHPGLGPAFTVLASFHGRFIHDVSKRLQAFRSERQQ